MTTCGPFKTTEGGFFDATVNSMHACKCFGVQPSPASPLPPPSSMLIFLVSHGVGLGWHISLSTLRLWGGGGARERLSRQKFHPLSEANVETSKTNQTCLSTPSRIGPYHQRRCCVVRGARGGVVWCDVVWFGLVWYEVLFAW